MQGSNGHNNGGGDGGDDGRSGNGGDNVVPLPTAAERARDTRNQKRIRTTIIMGKPGSSGQTSRQPFINLPPMTQFLVISIIAIEAFAKFILTPVQQYDMIDYFGFVPAYYTGDTPFAPGALWGPVTYAFIHGGWTHVFINAVMLMAFGAGLERWMGWKRLAILMLGCSLASALVHFLFNIGSENPVVGASGAISGMFAAAMIMLQQTRGYQPGGRFGYLPFIALWIVISVIFGMIGGPDGASIAWAAHIGGFLAGFALVKPVMRLKV